MSIVPVTLGFLILIGIFIILPLLLGVYVYRDAKQRNMNALLWTLVAALAPSFIGLIIYLLVRGNYSNLRCPKCNATVTEQYVVCPKCGEKLRPACSNCGMPIESDWCVCPKCTQPLPEKPVSIQKPVKPKDRSLWKVLALLIIVPVLLIAVLVMSFSVSTSGGSSSFREISFTDTEEMSYIPEAAKNWLEDIRGATGQAYALRYAYELPDSTDYYYLVYVPGTSGSNTRHFGQSNSIFGTTLTLELGSTYNNGGIYIIVLSSADKAPKLVIEVDGKKIDCDVTAVDYNPTSYYIEP